MNINEIKQAVEECLENLCQTFKNNPSYFLSERDLKSYLYTILINHRLFRVNKPIFKSKWLTRKKSRTLLIHTEFPYKDKIEDITILRHKKVIKWDEEPKSIIGIEIKFNDMYPYKKSKRNNMLNDIKSLRKDDYGYLIWFNWDSQIPYSQITKTKNYIDKSRKHNIKFYWCDMHSKPLKEGVYPKHI